MKITRAKFSISARVEVQVRESNSSSINIAVSQHFQFPSFHFSCVKPLVTHVTFKVAFHNTQSHLN